VALADMDLRVSSPDEPPRITGYGAVFNSPSEVLSDGYGKTFREYVAPGAFTRTLKQGADVRALLNHDPNYVLGRTTTGTLTLGEDEKGLWYTVTPPDTQWARDLMAVMRRGDIDQSSFAFRTIKDRWGVGKDDAGAEIDERWLLEAQLFDVSPVTYPAYPAATSDVRSLLISAGIDDAVLVAVERNRRGLPLSDAQRTVVRATIDVLQACLPTDSAPSGHSDTRAPDPAPSGHSVTPRVSPVLIDAARAQHLRARLERMARL
jgi:hypothetical protein